MAIQNLPKEIKNIQDVEAFIKSVSKNMAFHPDTDFSDYINLNTLKPTFSRSESAKLDKMLNTAFAVCKASNVDIYEIAINAAKNQ